MKKFLIIIFAFLFINNALFAEENVSFIYINGSNNNDKKMKEWFYKGVVKKLHPSMVKKFSKKRKSLYSNKNGYIINEKPVIFFWGDKSKADLDFVKKQLDISNAVSSAGATLARTLIAEYFHDAIWVQKEHNMLHLIDELNDVIKEENEKGNKVILFGYSAGSFVNFEYMFNKLPYIDMAKGFEALGLDAEILEHARNNPKNHTCISALRHGEMGYVSSEGHLIINNNNNGFLDKYDKMDDFTEKYCAPDNILGTVSFANPLVLFYSDISDPNYQINFYTKYMYKYIIEHGMFATTVNFREDPLGFSVGQNMTNEEIEKAIKLKIENPTGFVYSKSAVWSGRPFFLAHTSYWSAHRKFSTDVVKVLNEGYRFQYDDKFQKKMLNKRDAVFRFYDTDISF